MTRKTISTQNKSSMTDINILYGTSEDIDAIVQFQMDMAMESEGTILDKNTLEKGVSAAMTDENRGRYLVAKLDVEVVGSLMLTREWSDWNNCWYLWVQSVYVTPHHRGKGIYKAMYQKVRELAKEEGIRQIRLYVDKDNVTAQRVYKQLGMDECHYLMYEEEIN